MAKKSAKNKSLAKFFGCVLLLFFAGIILLGSYGIYLWYISQKENCKKKIVEEIATLKDFSARDAAAEKSSVYPPEPPEKSLEQINLEIDQTIKDNVATLFPAGNLSLAKTEIMRKYRAAKKGERIIIQLNKSNDMLEGVYNGRDGLSVIIGERRLKIIDIMDDYRYLFDEALADKIAGQKMELLDNEQKARTEAYVRAARIAEIEKRYPQAGYVKKEDGGWWHKSEMVEEYVSKKKNEHEAAREKSLKEIFSRNRIFGLIRISESEIEIGNN